MSKGIKTMLILTGIVAVVTLVFVFPFQHFNPFLDGQEGMSKSIEESKVRGVFISKYAVPDNPQKINDTLSIYVKQAWLEKLWYHTGWLTTNTEPHKEYYQLCLVVDEKSIAGYGDTWTIGHPRGRAEDRFFRSVGVVNDKPTSFLKAVARSFSAKEEFEVIRWKSDKIGDTESMGSFVVVRVDTTER